MATSEVQETHADQLRESGLRVTEPRLAVLAALSAHPHSDAGAIHQELAADHPRLSLQSVHNVLRDLTASRIVRRIEPADSSALYETRVGDNHHHVVCRGCGAVRDIDCVAGYAPCLHPDDPAGFAIDLAEVVFWGVCPDCQARGIRTTDHNLESPRRSNG